MSISMKPGELVCGVTRPQSRKSPSLPWENTPAAGRGSEAAGCPVLGWSIQILKRELDNYSEDDSYRVRFSVLSLGDLAMRIKIQQSRIKQF